MDNTGDDYSVDDAELAACVRLNIENIGRIAPAMKGNPIFLIALEQARALEARLENKE